MDDELAFPVAWPFLTARDISKWLGLPQRRVLQLVEQELITPSDPAPGKGNSRKYSLNDLLLFIIFSRLTDFGMAPRFLKTIAGEIDEIIRSRDAAASSQPRLLRITTGINNKLQVVADDANNDKALTLILDLQMLDGEARRLVNVHIASDKRSSI